MNVKKQVELVEMTLLEFSGYMSKENDNIKSTEHYSECCVLVHLKNGESFVVKYKDARDVVGYYVRDIYPLI